MKRAILIIVVCMLCMSLQLPAAAFYEHQSQVQPRNSRNEFGSLLFQTMVAQEPDNILISPVSVHSALSITARGANGSTADQMRNLLSPDEAFGAVDGAEHGLSIANSIWVHETYPLSQRFSHDVATDFGASVERLDFLDPRGADTINDWVSHATNHTITSIIDDLEPDMRMIIVNAVHFLGEWVMQFDPNDTRERVFYAPRGSYATDFMHNEASMLRFELQGAQGVVLPYTGNRFRFFALLPPGDMEVGQWTGELGSQLIDSVYNAMGAARSERTRLALPKFIDRFDSELSSPLKAMGMTDPFDPSIADFSGMNEQGMRDLFVDEVLHKTFIRVDEEGTEAAAVTAVVMRLTSIMPSGTPLIFDRPFLYGLIDTETESALFLGIMRSPESP